MVAAASSSHSLITKICPGDVRENRFPSDTECACPDSLMWTDSATLVMFFACLWMDGGIRVPRVVLWDWRTWVCKCITCDCRFFPHAGIPFHAFSAGPLRENQLLPNLILCLRPLQTVLHHSTVSFIWPVFKLQIILSVCKMWSWVVSLVS